MAHHARRATTPALWVSVAGAAAFTVFAGLTTQDHAARAGSPWQNDPYDRVVSFTEFLVPALTALILVRASLLRGHAPQPVFRITQLLRAAFASTLLVAAAVITDWLALALRADRPLWNDGLPWLVAALALLTATAAAGLVLQWRAFRRLPSRDPQRPARVSLARTRPAKRGTDARRGRRAWARRAFKTLTVLALVLVVTAAGYTGLVAIRHTRPVTLPAPTGPYRPARPAAGHPTRTGGLAVVPGRARGPGPPRTLRARGLGAAAPGEPARTGRDRLRRRPRPRAHRRAGGHRPVPGRRPRTRPGLRRAAVHHPLREPGLPWIPRRGLDPHLRREPDRPAWAPGPRHDGR